MEQQNNRKKSTRIKIVSLGDAEVGKSCIIKRYCEKRFVNKYLATIGIDYGVTKVYVDEKEVKVNIFDMAGHPIFYEVRNEFYKDTQGVLLVFDVSSQQSFDSLQSWLNEMKKEIGDPTDMDRVVFVVCANKTDKTRVVDESTGRIWANNCGFYYFETSAQTGDGVNKMFQTLFEEVIKTIDNGGKAARLTTTVGYTKEQAEAIQRLVNAKDNYERLGLHHGASRWRIACGAKNVPLFDILQWMIIDYSYRQHFDLDKKNEIHYHSWKENLKMSKIAMLGYE